MIELSKLGGGCLFGQYGNCTTRPGSEADQDNSEMKAKYIRLLE